VRVCSDEVALFLSERFYKGNGESLLENLRIVEDDVSALVGCLLGSVGSGVIVARLAFYGHSRQTSKSSDAKSRETMANADKNRASKAERHLDPVHDDVSVQKLEYSGLGRGCTAPITDSCRGNRVAMVVESDRKYGRRGQHGRP